MQELNLNSLSLDELAALRQKTEVLLEEKRKQKILEAYEIFEAVAEDASSTIEDIIEAGRKIQKERNIKYRDPNNKKNAWTGVGRKPKWIVKALESGASLSDFEV